MNTKYVYIVMDCKGRAEQGEILAVYDTYESAMFATREYKAWDDVRVLSMPLLTGDPV